MTSRPMTLALMAAVSATVMLPANNAASHTTGVAERNQRAAVAVLKPYGWHVGQQWRCTRTLWHRESGWDHRAVNPRSGATGIPQALPGWRMRSAGADWRVNPVTQIRWGARYIRGRYGSPCAALAHSNRKGWY